MSVAFVFPGQGSQSPGILHHLIEHPAVLRTLDEISEALGKDVRELDTQSCLEFTASVQLVVLAAGVATARALTEQGISPAAVAGLSVGAFAAAVVAGVVLPRDAVELVKLRAEQMQKLSPAGYGLSAIVGLSESEVTRIVESETRPEAPVFVGNINAPRQIVISGSHIGMEKVLEEARRQGAREAVPLHISVLSHSPLLQPVADLLSQRLSTMTLRDPQEPYVGNVTGHVLRTKEAIAYDLANNIAHGVRWHDATTVLKELGCNLFLEMPPGHVLSELAEQNLSGVNSVPVAPAVLPRILRLAQQEEAKT
jgi:malonate decarboxylase epsilon subunit